jgi:peroxiredoxin
MRSSPIPRWATRLLPFFRQYDPIWQRLEALEAQVAHLGVEAVRPAAPDGDGAEKRRGNRSLADSKINRSGLAAGTPAPGFRLPRLDGGELSLEEFRGRRVLLVFSDPQCGPCGALMPQLERHHRASSDVQVVMVSRGDREANRARMEEHDLTFPIVLQKQWEISRAYGIFATPVAYMLDEQGIVTTDVAVGAEAIRALLPAAALHPARGSLATLPVALTQGLPRREALRQLGLALASSLLAFLGVRSAWSQGNANPCAALCGQFGPIKRQLCLAGCIDCLLQHRTPCGASRIGTVICVNLQSDVQNCGSCGNRCSEGSRCAQGKCLPASPCPKRAPFYDPVWNVCCPRQFPIYDSVRNVCVQCRGDSDCGANEECCSGECIPARATCCGALVCPEGFPFCAEPGVCCTDPNRTLCTTRGQIIRSGSVINL